MKNTIIIVDDNPENLDMLASLLQAHGYIVHPANSGAMALKALQHRSADLVLLDICMPPPDGYEVCRQLKANPATRDIPVIFISALHEPLDKARAFEVGGVDYVPKPFNHAEVLSRVSVHVKLHELQEQQRRYAAELESLVRQKTAEVQQSNAALRAANAGLERALQVKDDFLMLMNHELRTPLNGVLGMAQLLRDGVAPERQEHLQLLEESGWRLLGMIDNLLQVAKESAPVQSGAGSFTLDMGAVCGESLRMVAALAQEKDIAINIDIDTLNWLEMPLDSARLHQILANLLDNAVKFTPPRGHIGLYACYSEDTLYIDIWDTGPGIPAADRERIFEPFVQLEPIRERHHEGLGMGLTLAHNLARLHGGRIDVLDRREGGIIFRVSLPAKAAAPLETPTAVAESAHARAEPEEVPEQLSADQAKQLQALVEQGDINGVGNFAEMLRQCESCPRLSKNLKTLTRSFNLRALKVLAKQQLEGNKNIG